MSLSRVEWLERHQIVIYLAALVIGAVAGLLLPVGAAVLELAA